MTPPTASASSSAGISDVYLVYAYGDRQDAKVLVDALRSSGWDVGWISPEVAEGGAPREALEQELSAAGCVVVAWSSNAAESSWVLRELDAKGQDTRIAVLLEDVPIPETHLQSLQVVNLVDWEPGEPHRGFDELVSAITALVGEPMNADSTPARSLLHATLRGHEGPVRWVGWSPDGRLIATTGVDATVRIWQAETAELIHLLEGHSAEVGWAAWAASLTTNRIATASVDGTVRIWEAETGRPLLVLNQGSEVWRAGWSPDGARIAAAGRDEIARVWDAGTGEEVARLVEGHSDGIGWIGWSPDGTRVATGGGDGNARIWDVDTASITHVLGGSEPFDRGSRRGPLVGWLAWSPSGTRIATAAEDGSVRAWNSHTGALIRAFGGHREEVVGVEWSPDGTSIATASRDGTARLWDVESGTATTILSGHEGEVRRAVWSPDGARVATAGEDRTARVWDATAGIELARLEGHTGRVWRIAWSPDAAHLATASFDNTARIWNIPAPKTRVLDDAQQVPDQAATEDLLGRARIAGALAGQLIEFHEEAKFQSFAIHIDGAWGSGKSSLANLTVEALRRDQSAADWIIPEPNRFFDAWRESQIGPAWWSLLTWLRQTVERNKRGTFSRAWFKARELFHRLRIAGLIWPTVITGLIVGLLVALLSGYAVGRADPDSQLAALDTFLRLFSLTAASVATAIGVGKALGRWLTWRTPSGARLFERRGDSPMDDVVVHTRWLRKQASGPIVLVVDDLDRCPATFVVETLEAIQTLLRSDAEAAQPLIIPVCADGRWLHVAFEEAYAEFTPSLARPGRPLGHLFLAKLFQLQIRVPDLDPTTATAFARMKLGLASPEEHEQRRGADRPRKTDLSGTQAAIEKAVSLDRKIDALDDLAATVSSPADAESLLDAARMVGRSAQSPATQRNLHHELEDFIPMLDRTPRAVVRFINAYAVQRIGIVATDARPSPESLARWTLIQLRWPSVARRLVAEPELLDLWHADGPSADDPDLEVLQSNDFLAVVVRANNRPSLDSRQLRECLGLPEPVHGEAASPL